MFEIPADFTIEEVLHGAFGIHVGDPSKARRVSIEFSPEKADLVTARQWHPTQELTQADSGRLRLSSRAQIWSPSSRGFWNGARMHVLSSHQSWSRSSWTS